MALTQEQIKGHIKKHSQRKRSRCKGPDQNLYDGTLPRKSSEFSIC